MDVTSTSVVLHVRVREWFLLNAICNLSAISWREQATFWLYDDVDDDDTLVVLSQHANDESTEWLLRQMEHLWHR
jgi:hypothetical protein